MDWKTFIVFNLNDRVLVGTWVGEWLGSVTSSQSLSSLVCIGITDVHLNCYGFQKLPMAVCFTCRFVTTFRGFHSRDMW